MEEREWPGIQFEGEEVLLTTENQTGSTTVRMPIERGLAYGLGVANACHNRSMTSSARTATPGAPTGGNGGAKKPGRPQTQTSR